jgi:hypothetical protein
MKNTRFFVIAALILVATFLRLAPLPANFSPIGGIALFAGALFVNKKWFAVLVPLIALALSDVILGYQFDAFVYFSYVLIALLGRGLIDREEKPQVAPVALSSLAASAIFFLVSNFGVWAQGLLYPRTGAGLVACYFAAVPFFWNTLVSDLVFTSALFGAWAFALKAVPNLRVVRG